MMGLTCEDWSYLLTGAVIGMALVGVCYFGRIVLDAIWAEHLRRIDIVLRDGKRSGKSVTPDELEAESADLKRCTYDLTEDEFYARQVGR